MARIYKPDLTDALTRFFLVAGENPSPDSLSEEVLFTFPFADAANKLINPVNSIASGLAGVQAIDHPVVPEHEYWLYHAIDGTHNDTTNRTVRLILFDPQTVFEVTIVRADNIANGAVQALARNIVVPPGWNLRVRAGVGGAFILTSNAMHTEHGLAQPVMNV